MPCSCSTFRPENTAVANFQLKRHKETVADLKRQIQQNGTVAIYGIHFDTASAKLRPDSLPSLNQVLQLVKSSPGARWTIAGHTDNQGGADYNLKLSLARAHSVVTWLTQHGVSGDVLTAKGYGLSRPVADNSTESGRALNRRVEVSLIETLKECGVRRNLFRSICCLVATGARGRTSTGFKDSDLQHALRPLREAPSLVCSRELRSAGV